MKKIILFIILLIMPIIANATSKCSYEKQVELESKANSIKTNYEEKEEILNSDEHYFPDYLTEEERKNYVVKYNYFLINILNLTDSYYMVITNNNNSDSVTINYSDTDNGKYMYRWENLKKVTTFTFSVFTSSNTECPDEKIRIFYLTTPRYNEFYSRDICENYKNESICQKYVTFGEITDSNFMSKIDNLNKKSIEDGKKEEPKSWYDNIINFIDKNKGWFITGGILVAVGVGTTIVIQRKRSKI